MNLSAYITGFSIEPDRKLVWLKVTIALAFSLGCVLSWRLWISSRVFPLSPISDSLPTIPFPIDYICFLLLPGLLLASAVVAQPRKLILASFTLTISLYFFDQTRGQPWVYQYLFMLAALGFYAWKKPEHKQNRAALNTCRLIVVCTYFWSGLQKLNISFVRETWPDLSGSFLRLLPSAKSLPPFLVLLIPLTEICIALGLLTRKYRNVSVILALFTHLVVLVLLMSRGENIVVWPWNVAMALFVVILFWQDRETSPRKILVTKNTLHMVALILFGVLPALSLFDLWDSYLSSALYSGNTDQAVIYVSASVIDHLPAVIYPYMWRSTEPFFLDINRWSYGELNVPIYPEARVYKKVTERICSYGGSPGEIKLRIKKKPDPLTGARESEYYDCSHLQ